MSTVVRTTLGIYLVHSFAKLIISSNDFSPNLLLTSALYSSLCGLLRLIDIVSIKPSISGTMSLPLTRFPTPLVLILVFLPYVFLTYSATLIRTSNLSVGSPNPQNTTSSYSSILNFSNSAITSSYDGSLSSQSLPDSPILSIVCLKQKVHEYGHLLVKLTYKLL